MAIPRIVYFTVKRFLSLCAWVLVGIVFGSVLGMAIQYSMQVLDNPWLPIAFMFLLMCAVACYNIAQLDVEREKREQDRVLDALSKE